MNPSPVARLDTYSDRLMTAAFSSTPETASKQLERLDAMSQNIGALVVQSWTSETSHLHRGLRAATFLACLPSLRTTAGLKAHTQAIATEVASNFEELSTTILTSPDLKPETIKTRAGRETFKDSVGQLSEIGVLGVLWWGIAHGLRHERSFALPATKQEDSGFRIKEGLSLATDIILRETNRKKLPIQVKTTATPERISLYHPEIAFVALSQLMGEDHPNPRRLLSFLAEYDNRQLGAVHSRLEILLCQAEEKTAAYQQSQTRQVPEKRSLLTVQAVKMLKRAFGGRGGNRTLNP
jgi:hypothetical protein